MTTTLALIVRLVKSATKRSLSQDPVHIKAVEAAKKRPGFRHLLCDTLQEDKTVLVWLLGKLTSVIP